MLVETDYEQFLRPAFLKTSKIQRLSFIGVSTETPRDGKFGTVFSIEFIGNLLEQMHIYILGTDGKVKEFKGKILSQD